MKVTDWRRKLAASLVAGGFMAPSLYGANLNTNLIPDPSFENVSGVTCCYTATELNSWQDGTQHGFAYTYGQGYDNRGPYLAGIPRPVPDPIISAPMPTMALPTSRRPDRSRKT